MWFRLVPDLSHVGDHSVNHKDDWLEANASSLAVEMV